MHCKEKSIKIIYILIVPVVIGLTGCSIPKPSPWSKDFTPPEALDTERMHIEPLKPEHVELDYAAIMGSRYHLQRTLHWGGWPRDDFTIAENYQDLKRHWKSFLARASYAYTVLSPDREKCLGCIYMNPAGEKAMKLTFWVIEEELTNGLDRYLLESVFDWIIQEWPFETVYVTLHPDNRRGILIAEGLGLALDEDASEEESKVFVWQRPSGK